MQKNIARAHSLVLLPLIASVSLLGMEEQTINLQQKPVINEQHNPLAESTIIPFIPTIRGLGVLRSLKDCLWNEEENIYAELKNKILDLNNSSYHRKLDTTVEIYSSDRKDSTKLANVLMFCRQEPYKGLIKINDTSARMAHIYLAQENKTQQSTLKSIIEKKDREFIEEYNKSLAELQQSMADNIFVIKKQLEIHLKERDVVVQEKCIEIRVVKKALVNLHHLNKTFTLPEDKKTDGYCSDSEKNAENVAESYNNEHLLKKIEIDFAMAETKRKAAELLSKLTILNQDLQTFQPVRY